MANQNRETKNIPRMISVPIPHDPYPVFVKQDFPGGDIRSARKGLPEAL